MTVDVAWAIVLTARSDSGREWFRHEVWNFDAAECIKIVEACMNKKRDGKLKPTSKSNGGSEAGNGAEQGRGADGASAMEDFAAQDIKTKPQLKSFLNSIRDKMGDNSAAPIYAMSAMNHVLTHSAVYDLLDNENKEIARDIWLRIKQSGLQVRMPGLLFSTEEIEAGSSSVS